MGWGSTVRRGLRKLQGTGVLRELRGIREALQRANELKLVELRAAGLWPREGEDPQSTASSPSPYEGVLITEVDTVLANELSIIELTLTRTLGMPPTDEQVIEEYNRLHTDEDDPRRLSVLEQGYRERGHRSHG